MGMLDEIKTRIKTLEAEERAVFMSLVEKTENVLLAHKLAVLLAGVLCGMIIGYLAR